MFTLLQSHSQRYYHFISTIELTKAALLSLALLRFHEHHLFSRVSKHPPRPWSNQLYYIYIFFYCDIDCDSGSSCFAVAAAVTCALCLTAQTLQRLPVPCPFLSAAAPVWGWTFRSLCLSTLPWLPSTKVSCSNIAWCLFIDVLCSSKILYFKGFVYFVLKTSETEHLIRIWMRIWRHVCRVSAVGWSTAPSFSPLLGEMVVEDSTLLQCNITGLTAVSSEWSDSAFIPSVVEIMEKNVLSKLLHK